MTEKELQSEVINLATKLGYSHYHTHDSRRSDYGFPDLVLVHESKRRVIFAETKSDIGETSVEQDVWLESLARCDQEVYIWKPEHLEEIVEILMLGHKPSITERLEMDSAVVSTGGAHNSGGGSSPTNYYTLTKERRHDKC